MLADTAPAAQTASSSAVGSPADSSAAPPALPLADCHLADLRSSGLSDATIAAAGLYTETDKAKIATLLNRETTNTTSKMGACLIFPYRTPLGIETGYHRVKPAKPRSQKTKGGTKRIKYEAPVGTPNRAYFPPQFRKLVYDKTAPIFITEGEKKSLALFQRDYYCIGLAGVWAWKVKDEGKLIPDLESVGWANREVYIVFDSDSSQNENVRAAEWHLSVVLSAANASVKVIRLPGGTHKKVGIDDYLLSEVADVQALMQHAVSPERTTAIKITPNVREMADKGIEALAYRGGVYQRAGKLVDLIRPVKPAMRAENGVSAPHTQPMKNARILELLSDAAKWGTEGETGFSPADVPARVANAVEARGTWEHVPPLEGIIEAPTLRPDGSVLQTAGYDAQTGLFLVPSCDFPLIPESPTPNDAIEAAGRLCELTSDFPWVSPAHQSAWVAALLTMLARHCIAGPVPIMVFDANAAGCGKTRLARIIALIASGREFPETRYTADGGQGVETGKLLEAVSLAAMSAVFFDDVGVMFGDASLNAIATSGSLLGRLLGKTETTGVVAVRAVVFATAVNIQYHSDTARRVLNIRLETPLENPEDRKNLKLKNIESHVTANRGKLAVDALTILRAFFVAGRPPQTTAGQRWGSFEAWSDLIREACMFAGLADPVAETRKLVKETKSDGRDGLETLRKLLAGLRRLDPRGEGVVVADMIAAANEPEYGDLREALVAISGDLKAKDIGYKLRKYSRRIVGGLRLESLPHTKRGSPWIVSGDDGEDGDDVLNPRVRNSSFMKGQENTCVKVVGIETSSSCSPSSPDGICRPKLPQSSLTLREGRYYCPVCDRPAEL